MTISKGTLGRNQFTDRPKRQPILVIGPSIAYVPLTRDQYALIEADDMDIVAQWNWIAHKKPQKYAFYAARTRRLENGKRVEVFMHHLLCPERHKEVDHRNRSTLDNRRNGNLRPANGKENSANRISTSANGLRGAYYVPKWNKFRARIKVNGKLKHLGYFSTAIASHNAYKAAAIKYFGEFACFESKKREKEIPNVRKVA